MATIYSDDEQTACRFGQKKALFQINYEMLEY